MIVFVHFLTLKIRFRDEVFSYVTAFQRWYFHNLLKGNNYIKQMKTNLYDEYFIDQCYKPKSIQFFPG